ncbi:MAG: hypothetical protein N0A16_10605 [Blastocatellia bacterium]|nr:hypothetical protein [Blastocatellia bacterium]MCS7158165.1 hypothetical protein [Blastocatellia bacterium]MCX7752972.1 hypothetical protein [Blastocatellia bacterium]MDW8168495.1 hypothetical protein [Acidobacteriota bacterium]MDW8256909.1 hypothetical protein [Acidobacteriota bacterium]
MLGSVLLRTRGAGVGLLLVYGLGLSAVAWGQSAASFRALSGYVVDERFSALRREPRLNGRLIARLRVGRFVAVLNERREADGTVFHRVATTRRTRGWLHERAFVMPARRGDDQRLLELIEQAEGFRRLQLARILVAHFERSPLRPRALLILAEEAERAAQELTARLRRQWGAPDPASATLRRQWFLNDVSLDRYNRLGITFVYDEGADRLRYDGWAYRELLARYPQSAESTVARERLRP